MNTWRFVAHGPDGVNYQYESVCAEFEGPERIVIDHASGPKFRMTITLAEEGGKVTISWRMLIESSAECSKV